MGANKCTVFFGFLVLLVVLFAVFFSAGTHCPKGKQFQEMHPNAFDQSDQSFAVESAAPTPSIVYVPMPSFGTFEVDHVQVSRGKGKGNSCKGKGKGGSNNPSQAPFTMPTNSFGKG